ncbi:UvrB/UvrC motif-containing protein [Patescibacteria group bacterium]|nr:UvrB/UvrC motif-containing protein [Patescibacteria group bacterium]
MEKFKILKKEEVKKLPKSPGVYAFKKKRELLYIGKAANLKKRVTNHFSQPSYRDNLFIAKINKIGFIKTDSEIEALILEAKLIKKHQPKYNVVWRDDKNYFFVGADKENFPRIFITHQPLRRPQGKSKLKTDFVGPFVDGKSLKQTLKTLRRVFPYRSCKALPKKPCLWHQINRCPAPCLTKAQIDRELFSVIFEKAKKECRLNAKNLLKVLQGKKVQALRDLRKEMKRASSSQNFEKAIKTRDQIKSLERVMSHSRIFELQLKDSKNWKEIEKQLKLVLGTKKEISRIEAYDVSNIQGKLATGSMITFIEGAPDKNFYRKFKIKIVNKPNDVAMIKEILERRLAHKEWPLPHLILIDGGKAQLNTAIHCLTYDVKQVGERGNKVKVISLAKKENKLYIEGYKQPILLKTLPREISNLILQIRDEAHRFAISYHKKLRDIDLKSNF